MDVCVGGFVSGEQTQDALLLLPSSNHTVTKQHLPRGLHGGIHTAQVHTTYTKVIID